jgi:ABC-type polysaccharide/polyol phosphate export permease
LVTFLYSFFGIMIVVTAFNGPIWLTLNVGYVLPFVVVLALFSLGLSLCFSIIGALVPDIRNLLPFGVMLMYYTSPVFIPREVFDAPVFQVYTSVNPVTAMLDIGRDIFIHGTAPKMRAFVLIAGYGAILTGLGLLIVRQYGRRLVFYV